MPTIRRADYVLCRSEGVLVPRSRLRRDEDLFEDEAKPACPFCGSTDLEELKRGGGDEGQG